MMKCIGIRHEDKYLLERRVPIVPADIKKILHENDLKFCIESSDKRIYKDDEFENMGAELCTNLDNCDVILGVKEIPETKFLENKTYVIFSHVIKGQSYNMQMLRKLMELNCSMIDYEKITDSDGRRLIFFGRFAGLAGMLNTLWSLGQRYKEQGIITPFINVNQAQTYNSLDDAIADVQKIADEIKRTGLPDEILPFITAFTGYGNVARGAWEIFDLLPFIEISPDEIATAKPDKHFIYKVVFKEQDLVEHKTGEFDLHHYYDNPNEYSDKFHQYLPYLSCVVNGMYWDERYPRIITKANLKSLFEKNNLRLAVIGDISCDPHGSVECTHKGTEIEEPVFVYNPTTTDYEMGFKGDGVLVMAVDILPSELPRESSQAFSSILKEFIPVIANADYTASFENIDLPPPIKNALILLNGKLTPEFEYISKYL